MALLADRDRPRPTPGSERTRRDALPGDADRALMDAFLSKDSSAAGALYDRYASRIYGLGLVLFRSKTDAEDLVQDTFLKVWRTGSAFDPRRGSLDGWILMNARSLGLDRLRRRTLQARELTSQSRSEVLDEPGPEQYAEHRDLIERARGAMDLLSAEQRAAVELAYLGQRSSAEVAAIQGIPIGTVKSRVRAGLAVLRRALSEDGSDRTVALGFGREDVPVGRSR